MTSFSIAACNSLRAPSWSNCSKNGFSSSSARLPSEITLLSGTGASFLLASSGEAAAFLFCLLRGCAFSQLLIHNFRLYLYPPNLPALVKELRQGNNAFIGATVVGLLGFFASPKDKAEKEAFSTAVQAGLSVYLRVS